MSANTLNGDPCSGPITFNDCNDDNKYLLFKRLDEKAILPTRGSQYSAGLDLSSIQDITIPSNGRTVIQTGWAVSLPYGTYGRIAPRSGLAVKHGIDVGAGVVDQDYVGKLGVVLFNHSTTDFKVNIGDRIAQLIVEVIQTPIPLEVKELDTTVRGANGFGSTGVSSLTEQSLVNQMRREELNTHVRDILHQPSVINSAESTHS